MPVVYLLRHGESESNREECYQGSGESPLTQQGQKEARAVSRRLKKIPFAAAFSSELSRAYETAGAIAKPHGIPVEKVRGLRERSYGHWEGKRFDEIEQRWPVLYRRWLTHPAQALIPGAETLKELQNRAVHAFLQLVKGFKKEDSLLMVAHGGWNRALLFHFLGLKLDHFWHVRQTNCGLNIIEVHSRPVIRMING